MLVFVCGGVMRPADTLSLIISKLSLQTFIDQPQLHQSFALGSYSSGWPMSHLTTAGLTLSKGVRTRIHRLTCEKKIKTSLAKCKICIVNSILIPTLTKIYISGVFKMIIFISAQQENQNTSNKTKIQRNKIMWQCVTDTLLGLFKTHLSENKMWKTYLLKPLSQT